MPDASKGRPSGSTRRNLTRTDSPTAARQLNGPSSLALTASLPPAGATSPTTSPAQTAISQSLRISSSTSREQIRFLHLRDELLLGFRPGKSFLTSDSHV